MNKIIKLCKWMFNKDDNWYWVFVSLFMVSYLIAILLNAGGVI